MASYLLDAFSGPGGGFMWAITALLAFALAVVLERVWTLEWRHRLRPERLERALDEGPEAAVREAPGALAEVLAAGLQAPVEAAWDAMSAVAVRAELELRSRIGYLSVVGHVATLLGLLGTVYGLVLAFGALGDTAAGERALQLSQGISTAMATTAYGLLVAIPSLLAHAWLDQRARRLLAWLDYAGGRLVAARRTRP